MEIHVGKQLGKVLQRVTHLWLKWFQKRLCWQRENKQASQEKKIHFQVRLEKRQTQWSSTSTPTTITTGFIALTSVLNRCNHCGSGGLIRLRTFNVTVFFTDLATMEQIVSTSLPHEICVALIVWCGADLGASR